MTDRQLILARLFRVMWEEHNTLFLGNADGSTFVET